MVTRMLASLMTLVKLRTGRHKKGETVAFEVSFIRSEHNGGDSGILQKTREIRN